MVSESSSMFFHYLQTDDLTRIPAYRCQMPVFEPSFDDDSSLEKGGDYFQVLERIAHWLPAQGPLKDFVHHNTLHAVQHLPFHQGVILAAKMYGACSYLPRKDYQQFHQQGRIRDFAIDWALQRTGCDLSEQQNLRAELFESHHSSHYPPLSLANHGIRRRWFRAIDINLDDQVHPVLFRLLSNYLDQGISRWSAVRENETFWQWIGRLALNSLVPLYPLHEPTAQKLLQKSPEQVIYDCLGFIVGDSSWHEQYLLELLLAHPGWSGMVRHIQQQPDCLLAARTISLDQLVAVELVLELAFLKLRGGEFICATQVNSDEHTMVLKNGHLIGDIPLPLQVWHEAMEWSLHCELLAALKTVPPSSKPREINVQALFCIDDRECSLRRYLEEQDEQIETFGAAGFFGIDFYYQGLNDAYPVAQCPNVIKPQHLIKETGSSSELPSKPGHLDEHGFWRGWFYTQTLGLGYAMKMAWDVFRPSGHLPGIRQLSEVQAHTRLHLLREHDEPNEEGYLLGFSLSEMADRVEGLLRNIGLTEQFAPLIMVVAHGSSSANNPHFAAYDCGACSGKPGAPNARAFAWMANYNPVRYLLQERGIVIPETTQFVAALHNTSRDEMIYFIEKELSSTHSTRLAQFKKNMQHALRNNALERSRWFALAPDKRDAKTAHQHVKERSVSIFEPRPELNHSNNLYCIVGRRSLTRHLFLDRRAFLHSYDPDSDTSGRLLQRVLQAVIPVCGGINLEYLFSRLDNSAYGAGTKLPHNVIGLLGVANGVEGDLRTGLPSQMIEVHDPARLLIVIEQTVNVVDRVISQLGHLKDWLDNEWVRLVACDPATRQQHLYHKSGWQNIEIPDDYDVPSAADSLTLLNTKVRSAVRVYRLTGDEI
jgi:uncharacterized protein YbcC (UPF0753/DUF2309 family)